MKRRTILAALGAGMVSVAGCLGQRSPGSNAGTTASKTETPTDTSTETATPLPPGNVDFPDGPKEPPARPSQLTESTVREYVESYEYRLAYNLLWFNEHTDVQLECGVDSVEGRPWGYEAVVTCSGYSNTDPPENDTGTDGPHADWFTQTFRYRVSENATHREREESRNADS